jgi:hypothetical protein
LRAFFITPLRAWVAPLEQPTVGNSTSATIPDQSTSCSSVGGLGDFVTGRWGSHRRGSLWLEAEDKGSECSADESQR